MIVSDNPDKRTSSGAVMHRRMLEAAEHRRRHYEHQRTDPVERARLHLQRRGWAVYAASVVHKGRGWIVGRAADPIDDAGLIALARRHGAVLP